MKQRKTGKILLSFTRDQILKFLKMVYLGNMLTSRIRNEKSGEEYDSFVQWVYSQAYIYGMDKYIAYDGESERFIPTAKLEDEADVGIQIYDYDNEVFWDELIYRLASRDLVRLFGEDAIDQMYPDEVNKLLKLLTKYWSDEFAERGLESLDIVVPRRSASRIVKRKIN